LEYATKVAMILAVLESR